MKLGIMQPYFFPYIGYWQLLNAVDEYVIFDDVNYINRGWINRNRILVNGEPQYINLQLAGASQNKRINEIEVACDPSFAKKRLRTLEQSYKKAPYYQDAMALVVDILEDPEKNLAKYLHNQLRKVCKYLQIDTKLILSSELTKDNSLQAEDKILDICQVLGADAYYNAIGGQELYTFSKFAEKGISLNFVQTGSVVYDQGTKEFVPNLSIIDVMMFNSVEQIREFLQNFTLITDAT